MTDGENSVGVKCMKAWQDFLDSLSTKGGNILLMFMALGGLMAFVHHIANDTNIDQSIISAAHDMMVGFGAALLAVLSGSASKQQMVDRTEVSKGITSASQVTETIKVETPNPTLPPAPAPNPSSPWVKS